MSYWPPHLKPGKCSYYYPDDEVSCGSADSIVEIIGLNEAVLPAVWAKELDKDFNNVSHNCCTVSATLLLEGLRATVFSGVGSYFRTAWRQFRSAGHTFDVSLDSLFGNLVVWDPNAVENLAKYTKRLVAP
jgi:hypothetical protein